MQPCLLLFIEAVCQSVSTEVWICAPLRYYVTIHPLKQATNKSSVLGIAFGLVQIRLTGLLVLAQQATPLK